MLRTSVMPAAPFEIAEFAALLSDPSRVRILLALMDGSLRPASELARIAGVARSTTSVHLQRLEAGGLLCCEPQGRHRYFRLASDEVADALEAVALLQPKRAPKGGDEPPERRALSEARTCYRHLAGRLGVALLGALERARYVGLTDGAVELTDAGRSWLEGLGVERSRWAAGRPCLDWTERRFHLGGELGAQLTEQLFALRWLARRRETRALRVTETGRLALARHLGVRLRGAPNSQSTFRIA